MSLLRVRDLKMHFPMPHGVLEKPTQVQAVDGISFDLNKGETLGLVGESGCGKSTTGRAILQLLRPTSGTVEFADQELTSMWRRSFGRWVWNERLLQLRKEMQIIFQDPYASLNPRMTVEKIVAEPLVNFSVGGPKQQRAQVQDLLERVGMNPRYIRRYPHEFSGGQRQRIGIARALALKPRLIVADEPISALDVSIQAQILNLMQDIQDEFGLTYLFIAHDLSAVRHISDRIAVMYLGRIVELAKREELYASPQHPYTQALISAIPIPDPVVERRRKRIVITGDVPSPISPPTGCYFHTRCPLKESRCEVEEPKLREVAPGHQVACHLV